MKKQLKLIFLGLVVAIMACMIEPFISQAEITGTVVKDSGKEVLNSKTKINFQPQVPIPGFETKDLFNDNSTSPIAKLIKALYAYGIRIITLIALVAVIIGGFMWATAGGSKQKVGEAQQWIKSGISGILLISFAYVILRTINVKLVDLETREIASVSPTKIEGKSDQKQATEDYGFFDRYYSFPPIGDNPTKEACCIAYDDNLIAKDKIHFASILYTDGTKYKVMEQCDKFAKDLYKVDEIERLSTFDWHDRWTRGDYEKKCPLGKACVGILPFDFACWDDRAGDYVNKVAKGKDSASFCQGRDNGTSCILTNVENKRKWGFCLEGLCVTCRNYGDDCLLDDECPDEKKAIGQSTWITNWKCGSEVDGDCDGGKCAGKPKN
ncbi:MAG TPA: hypothetical protein PLT32_02650 [bacterium]|nr:hypothetical protein [bacterium]